MPVIDGSQSVRNVEPQGIAVAQKVWKQDRWYEKTNHNYITIHT